jgi:CDP-glycerol glycerophosphotransferase
MAGPEVANPLAPAPGPPAVAVVVIVHDDAARLPTAVRSVLRQTLRSLEVVIVDDASTDDTPRVAAELAAADPRVRVVTHERNSGGCGRPRNTGIAESEAPNVMFLDSDDRLERHACKNLLEALEDSGADFAMGRVRRQYMATGANAWWFPELVEERRVVHGLAEDPGFIEDVLSVNKLYRREFLDRVGLRFPEDVHFEDQLFSLRAYHRARAFAVIPEMVYVWCVYESADRRSITQRRGELDSVRQRLEVHRRIDEYIAEHGDAGLQKLKDEKFLRNDLRLYLRDVLLDDGVIEAVLGEAGPYLRGLPADRFDGLAPSLRVAYGMALRGDVVGLRQAIQWNHHNALALDVAPYGDGARVARRGADPRPDPAWPEDALENTLLEVDPAVLAAPVPTVHVLHEVTAVEQRGTRVTLHGRSVDPLGKLDGEDVSLAVRVVRQNPTPRVVEDLPIRPRRESAHTWSWEADLPLGRLTVADVDAVWVAYLQSWIRAREVRAPLLWALGPDRMRLHSAPWLAALGRTVDLVPTETGRPQVVVSTSPGLRRKVSNRLRTRYLPELGRRLDGVRPESPTPAGRRAYAALRRLPVDPHKVVFEANLGTIYGDSPKYVYEEMRRSWPSMRATWVLPEGHPAPHEGVEVVQRGTTAYLRALATAGYWVDNQTFPHYVRKRPGQRYLQTWHGIPLKKMGRDLTGEAPSQRPDRGVGAWDLLCVPGPYFERVFVPAFDYRGELVRYGTPRNDPLVDGSVSTAAARRALDLPPDATVVLYAPTFRESTPGAAVEFEPLFDVERLVDRLPADAFLLLRAHYLNSIRVPGHLRYRVVDVSSVEDVNLLYLAADVLVTDYSSVMYDYAVLDRPMVFHVPDLADYSATRGMYVDLREIAPGPLTESDDELGDAVGAALSDPGQHAAQRARFREEWCGHEDGRASARALEALLGERPAP